LDQKKRNARPSKRQQVDKERTTEGKWRILIEERGEKDCHKEGGAGSDTKGTNTKFRGGSKKNIIF